MWTALLVLLVLLLLVVSGFAALWYYVRSDKIQTERRIAHAEAEKVRVELASKEAAQKAALALSKTRQEAALSQLRAATNALMRLLSEATRLESDAASLKTNDAGRLVGLFPDLAGQARHFYDTDLQALVPRDEIVTRLEGVRRIEQQLIDSAGTAYEPAPELSLTASNSTVWTEPALQKAVQLRQILTTLVQESKVKVTDATVTPASPALEAAMAQASQNETAAGQRLAAETTSSAKAQAVKIAAAAEAEEIIADAKRKSAEILAKAQEEADKQTRELSVRQAQGKVEDTQAKVAVEKASDDAKKIELKKKAADPAIQAKLAPFITPGYAQIDGLRSDLKPLSYTALQNSGALANDMRGLGKLVIIAWTSADRVRPRWKMNPQLFNRHPDEIEKVKEVQQLLIELGPVLVEMGKLQP
jgi:hypothetical protein